MLAIVLVMFLVLLLAGFPIIVSMGIPALLYVIVEGLPISTMAYSAFQALNSFPLVASPLFVLMGCLINEFGETTRLFNFCRVLMRNAKGYTAKVNIIVSLLFAGMSGAAVADIGGLGQVEIKAMEEEGFSRDYACAVTAATSMVGPIFPPSIPLLIFAVLAQQSPLHCLMSGAIPAFAIVVCLYIFISFQCRTKLKGYHDEHPAAEKESLWAVTKEAAHILFLIPAIIVAMLGGFCSPSEAGAAAVIYILIVEAIKGKFSFSILKNAIVGTYKTVSNIFIIIAVASFFTKVLTLEHFPEMVTSAFLGMADSPFLILLLINLLVLFVGMYMETISALTILTPILLPVAAAIGVAPVHLGVILVLNLTIGMLTPPFGVGLYTVATVGKEAPHKVLKELLPLYVPLLIALMVVTYVPGLTMWLPSLL